MPQVAGTGPGRPDATTRVALRVLVLATDEDDVQLPGWLRILDRVGMPYDVLHARREAVDPGRLVRPDGVGRYCAVLLTSSGLLVHDEDGDGWACALDPFGWESLWQYESRFGVRQVALNAAPAGGPEPTGLRAVAEGPTGPTPVQLTLTAAGASVFDDLRGDALVPLADAWVYRARLDGAGARALLTLDGDVVAAVCGAPDGRERLYVCFTVGAAQPVEELLGRGLLRWACRGVHLGELHRSLTVDVDDWCDLAAVPEPSSAAAGAGPPGRPPVHGATTAGLLRAQAALRTRHPAAAGFAFTLAFNAGGAPQWGAGPDTPVPAVGADPVRTPAGRAGELFWVNHTLRHRWLEDADDATCLAEITDNLLAAGRLGLPVEPAVLKTPGYSGLGVLGGTGYDDRGALVDRGLAASNPALLRAAVAAGVRFVHGNMSFPSHRPAGFNGGTRHPLAPSVLVVPDWPTAIAWWAATPQEAVDGYTALHRGAAASRPSAGRHRATGTPVALTDLTYRQVVEAEAEQAFRHLASGSVYTHTLHRANTYEYEPGRSLAVDWLDAVLDRYEAVFSGPLHIPRWSDLADHVAARTRHTAAVESGLDAVWDKGSGTVTVRTPVPASVFVTGAVPDAVPDAGTPSVVPGSHGDVVSRSELAAGGAVVLRVRSTA